MAAPFSSTVQQQAQPLAGGGCTMGNNYQQNAYSNYPYSSYNSQSFYNAQPYIIPAYNPEVLPQQLQGPQQLLNQQNGTNKNNGNNNSPGGVPPTISQLHEQQQLRKVDALFRRHDEFSTRAHHLNYALIVCLGLLIGNVAVLYVSKNWPVNYGGGTPSSGSHQHGMNNSAVSGVLDAHSARETLTTVFLVVGCVLLLLWCVFTCILRVAMPNFGKTLAEQLGGLVANGNGTEMTSRAANLKGGGGGQNIKGPVLQSVSDLKTVIDPSPLVYTSRTLNQVGLWVTVFFLFFQTFFVFFTALNAVFHHNGESLRVFMGLRSANHQHPAPTPGGGNHQNNGGRINWQSATHDRIGGGGGNRNRGHQHQQQNSGSFVQHQPRLDKLDLLFDFSTVVLVLVSTVNAVCLLRMVITTSSSKVGKDGAEEYISSLEEKSKLAGGATVNQQQQEYIAGGAVAQLPAGSTMGNTNAKNGSAIIGESGEQSIFQTWSVWLFIFCLLMLFVITFYNLYMHSLAVHFFLPLLCGGGAAFFLLSAACTASVHEDDVTTSTDEYQSVANAQRRRKAVMSLLFALLLTYYMGFLLVCFNLYLNMAKQYDDRANYDYNFWAGHNGRGSDPFGPAQESDALVLKVFGVTHRWQFTLQYLLLLVFHAVATSVEGLIQSHHMNLIDVTRELQTIFLLDSLSKSDGFGGGKMNNYGAATTGATSGYNKYGSAGPPQAPAPGGTTVVIQV
ncbi:unnamed protein product [Amoebophrya sp. A120]|nr:unnamed protein product [Amoebophrya sp. A120]|eukprot:GSA120T00006912001.1